MARSVAFVYGTLKRGFGNHWLMEELIAEGHAAFVGMGRTKRRYPLVCGPYQVPFLLNFPSRGHFVEGELYLVDDVARARLDDLEGLTKGHYQRCPILLQDLQLVEHDHQISAAEAYFAASSYAEELLQSSSGCFLKSFGAAEAARYVRRKDRPEGVTFLEHVQAWIQSRRAPLSRMQQVQPSATCKIPSS